MTVTRRASDGLRTLGRAAAPTRGAADRRVDLEIVGNAEGRLGEIDLDPEQGVLASAGARTRSAATILAEKSIHDVVERKALSETAAAGPERIAAAVISRAFIGIGQHFIGRRDVFELLGSVGPGVDVGVQLAREFAVGLLDFVSRGVAPDTESLVVVL